MAYTGSKAQAGRGSKIEIGPIVGASTTPVTFTGNTTSGSPSVASVSSTVGLAVGQVVSGTGVTTGTTISAVGSGTITLSANATATGSGVSLTATPTAAFVEIGEIKKAGLGKAAFDKEDVSNFNSNLDKEFLKLMRDNGMPMFSGNRVASDAGQLAAVAAFNDGDNAYQIRITLRKRADQLTTGDVYTFNALVMGLQIGDIETNKSIPWELELQITGPVTFTAGS